MDHRPQPVLHEKLLELGDPFQEEDMRQVSSVMGNLQRKISLVLNPFYQAPF